MDDVSGIERAVFGARERVEIDAWLDRHLRSALGVGATRVLLRAGRVSAVYGVEVDDARQVVVKAHRSPADGSYLAAAARCQRVLAQAGYPCPEPLAAPFATDGVTAVVETLTAVGEPGDGHDPVVRRAVAASLAAQIQLLRGMAGRAVRRGAPAWARYDSGPWPTPHDPIFDFRRTPPAYQWLDELARRAAAVLGAARDREEVVAHADWCCGNLLFTGGEVSASHDWDSVAAAPEAVLVGLTAGQYTAGGTTAPDVPTAADVTAFCVDYEDVSGRVLTGAEQRIAAAAATWVAAYNARCDVSALGTGEAPAAGSWLAALCAEPDALLHVRW